MNAIGVTSIIVRRVLSNHTITISESLSGISVDIMHGIEAEKNSIEEIDVTPIMNLVTIGASLTKSAGKNISAIPRAAAFDVSIASGI